MRRVGEHGRRRQRTPLNALEDGDGELLGEARLEHLCLLFLAVERVEEGEVSFASHLALEDAQTVEAHPRNVRSAGRGD